MCTHVLNVYTCTQCVRMYSMCTYVHCVYTCSRCVHKMKMCTHVLNVYICNQCVHIKSTLSSRGILGRWLASNSEYLNKALASSSSKLLHMFTILSKQ